MLTVDFKCSVLTVSSLPDQYFVPILDSLVTVEELITKLTQLREKYVIKSVFLAGDLIVGSCATKGDYVCLVAEIEKPLQKRSKIDLQKEKEQITKVLLESFPPTYDIELSAPEGFGAYVSGYEPLIGVRIDGFEIGAIGFDDNTDSFGFSDQEIGATPLFIKLVDTLNTKAD